MLEYARPLARVATLAFAVILCACGGQGPGFDVVSHDATIDIFYFDIPHFADHPADALLGRVCHANSDCDDGIACTDDLCDNTGRCENIPNGDRCDDGVYCNGAEQCDVHRGCIRGAPVSCDDNYVCTEDRCDETTRMCVHLPLDRDHDLDPDEHCHAIECGDAGVPEPDSGVPTPCWRGHDCDDLNPLVSSLLPELCGDGIDNNCNGYIDSQEPGGCTNAPNDRCDNPLDVSAGGVFTLQMGASRSDYMFTCAGGLAHDVTAVLHLTAPKDIDIRASSATSIVAMALETNCGSANATDTLECSFAFPAEIRRHSLPAGDYFLLVGDPSDPGNVTLTVHLSDPTPQPPNDTCAGAIVVPTTGGVYQSDLIGATNGTTSVCGGNLPNGIYTFTTTAPQDVVLSAVAGSRTEYLTLSLASSCGPMANTLRCDSGSTVTMTAHELPAGTYYAVVQSADPIDYTIELTFNPPTPPTLGDTCGNPITLVPETPALVSSGFFENDYLLSCATSGRDTVFQFTLASRMDAEIDVVGTTSQFLIVSLGSACPPNGTTELTCQSGTNPQVSALGLDPGTYYAIVKPIVDTDYQVTLHTYPPLMVMPVSGNDNCSDAFAIPPGRGDFTGDTTMLNDDYSAPCVTVGAGMRATPGNDAVFVLHLDSPQRVTLSLDASFFAAMWIAQVMGTTCPGMQPSTPEGDTCAIGIEHVDLSNTLQPGDYDIFIDGLSTSDNGTYSLLVNFSMP